MDAVPVFWPPATATDNLKVDNVEYSIQNGSFFIATGTPERVFVTAFDSFSNSRGCFFTVTVNKRGNISMGKKLAFFSKVELAHLAVCYRFYTDCSCQGAKEYPASYSVDVDII